MNLTAILKYCNNPKLLVSTLSKTQQFIKCILIQLIFKLQRKYYLKQMDLVKQNLNTTNNYCLFNTHHCVYVYIELDHYNS